MQMTAQLRRLAVASQGLTPKQQFGTGLAGTRSAIEHLGYVQIDTISVVERAHHHVLWSRVPGYDAGHLNRLVADKQIFEYWYHAASYLPMRDYRYALLKMASVRRGENRYYPNVNKRLANEILARVKAEGPLRVRDFDTGSNKEKGGWWNRGPGVRALDKLFMQGDLMVCERIGMEKVYDLTERCLPDEIDLSMPSLDEYAAYLFDTTLRAHGVFTFKQLIHLQTGKPMRDAMQRVLDERIEAGLVVPLDHGDWPKTYVGIEALNQAPKTNRVLKLLSPFDNAVIHRDRLNSLFGFDYRIECYVPAPKRVFGYFCLPVLYNDKFVGRVDCKAHRAQKRLEVINLHLEDVPGDQKKFFSALNDELQRFAEFNQCLQLDGKAIQL